MTVDHLSLKTGRDRTQCCTMGLIPRRTPLLFALWCVAFRVHCSELVSITRSPGHLDSRLCGNVNTMSTIQLTCPRNTWFHVISKTSSEDSLSNCSSDNSASAQLLSSSSHTPALVTVCRGPQSTYQDPQLCHESIQVKRNLNESNINFFQVTYRCIEQSLQYNMCEQRSENVTSGDLYLASPSLFSLESDAVSPSTRCHCTVTFAPGDFSARALYLSQHEDWNATFETNSSHSERQLGHFPAVNEDLFKGTSDHDSPVFFQVEFLRWSQNNQAENVLWIHITGSSPLQLQCNRGDKGSTSTPSSTDSSETSGTSSKSLGNATSSTANVSTTSSTFSSAGNTAVTGISSNPANQSPETGVTTKQSSATGVTSGQSTGDSVTVSLTQSSVPSYGTTGVVHGQTDEAASFQDTHIYIIVGVVCAVLLVIAVVVIVVIIKKRQGKQGKVPEPPADPETTDHSTYLAGSPACFSVHDYSEIDLSDNNNDTRMPPSFTTNSRRPADRSDMTNINARTADENTSHTGQPEVILMKPVSGTVDKDAEQTEEKRKRNPAGQGEYFVLEPQPAIKKERGVLFLTDRQGNDLIRDDHRPTGTGHDGLGTKTGGTTTERPENCEDSTLLFAGDTEHPEGNYYSVIKEGDEYCEDSTLLFAGDTEDPEGNYYSVIKEGDESSPHTRGGGGRSGSRRGPVDHGDYEEVDIKDENLGNLQLTPRSNSSTLTPEVTFGLPHSKTCVDEDSDDGELIMVDNVAYVSAEEVQRDDGRTNDSDDDDDDELVMIDNAAYESSASLQKKYIPHLHPCDHGAIDNESLADSAADDDVVMIDNVAYVSSDSVGNIPFPTP